MWDNILIQLYNEMRKNGIQVLDYPQCSTKAATICNASGYGVFMNSQAIKLQPKETVVLVHELDHPRRLQLLGSRSKSRVRSGQLGRA